MCQESLQVHALHVVGQFHFEHFLNDRQRFGGRLLLDRKRGISGWRFYFDFVAAKNGVVMGGSPGTDAGSGVFRARSVAPGTSESGLLETVFVDIGELLGANGFFVVTFEIKHRPRSFLFRLLFRQFGLFVVVAFQTWFGRKRLAEGLDSFLDWRRGPTGAEGVKRFMNNENKRESQLFFN